MKPALLLSFLLLWLVPGRTQPIPQSYIDEALANNRVLKEKNIALEKSLLALKEARSLFLPAPTSKPSTPSPAAAARSKYPWAT